MPPVTDGGPYSFLYMYISCVFFTLIRSFYHANVDLDGASRPERRPLSSSMDCEGECPAIHARTPSG